MLLTLTELKCCDKVAGDFCIDSASEEQCIFVICVLGTKPLEEVSQSSLAQGCPTIQGLHTLQAVPVGVTRGLHQGKLQPPGHCAMWAHPTALQAHVVSPPLSWCCVVRPWGPTFTVCLLCGVALSDGGRQQRPEDGAGAQQLWLLLQPV